MKERMNEYELMTERKLYIYGPNWLMGNKHLFYATIEKSLLEYVLFYNLFFSIVNTFSPIICYSSCYNALAFGFNVVSFFFNFETLDKLCKFLF